MEYSFIDKYSNMESLIHRLDPRTKIIASVIFIFFVIFTLPYDFFEFSVYFIIVSISIVIAHIPLLHILKKTVIIVPYLAAVALLVLLSGENQMRGDNDLSGSWILWNVSVKSFLIFIALSVLSSTTRFDALLKGLERLHFPKVMIMLFSFMYRYLFVIIDEVTRIERAWKSRYFGGELVRQIKIFGNIIGLLFIKTYQRGERIYQNMLSRGFDGEIRTLKRMKFTKLDIIFFTLFLGILLAAKFLSRIAESHELFLWMNALRDIAQ